MLRISLERNLRTTPRAPDVEPEDAYGVVFLVGGLFAGVEFAAFVDVFAAGGAFHAEGGHQADGLEFGGGIFGFAVAALEFGGVEVGGVVFGEDLSLGHCGGVAVGMAMIVVCLVDEEGFLGLSRRYPSRSARDSDQALLLYVK